MSDEIKTCNFNFSKYNIEKKLEEIENKKDEFKISLIAKFPDVNINNTIKMKALELTMDDEDLIELKGYRKAISLATKLVKLLKYVKSFGLNTQKHEYEINITGNAYVAGLQIPTEPQLVFDLLHKDCRLDKEKEGGDDVFVPDFNRPVYGYECIIVKGQEDRDCLLREKSLRYILFLGDKAYVVRYIGSKYQVVDEVDYIYFGNPTEYERNTSHLECIYRSNSVQF